MEVHEVLPRRLAPIDDGVRTWRLVVGLRGHLHVNTVEHRLNSDHHGVKFYPLGLRLQLQHVKLCLGPSTILCRLQKDPSNKEITSATTPTMNYSPFSSSANFFTHPDAFSISSWSCPMVWRSWPSSASYSTSITVVSNNMTVQQCEPNSLFCHTFSLLGDVS